MSKTATRKRPAAAGLPGDPAIFKALTEIDIIAHLAAVEFERRLPDGLTKAQFGVLNHLLRLGAAETVGELAHAFQVAQPTMSSTVKRLAAKGLADFVPDEEDGRVKLVRITRAGRALRERAVKAIAPHLAVFQAEAPEIDWAAILPALTRIRVFLDERR